MAEGEGKAISTVFGAIHEAEPDAKLITLKYLEMLPHLAQGTANKIFLPYEASGIMSALVGICRGGEISDDRPASTAREGVGFRLY